VLLRQAIGAALRRRRAQLGKTLRQLADESRVSLPYLSEVERGRKEASSEILASICRVLDLSVPELLDGARAEFETALIVDLTSRIGQADAPATVASRSADGAVLAA
jgi:transcriptional regulator with XRE-family HTH domain